MGKSVLVAFSGGVDSTVASALLLKDGFEVEGIHFNFSEGSMAPSRIEERNNIAQKLGITLREVDLRDKFSSSVIKYFAQEYTMGRTPCPCSYCNRNMKWEYLYQHAINHNFDKIATGHYVRIGEVDGQYRILKGVDQAKDQSYFLWNIPSQFLAKSITPLGLYTKKEVKQMAIELGFFHLANKPESMSICFLEKQNYRDFLAERTSTAENGQGIVVDHHGNILGKHQGVHLFTIGQKKGIENLQKGYCVTGLNANQKTVTVGPWDSIYYNTLSLTGCMLPSLCEGTHNGLRVFIRGFGMNPKEPCTLIKVSPNDAVIELSDPAWAPMPGQPTAIYSNDILLGGGYLNAAWNR